MTIDTIYSNINYWSDYSPDPPFHPPRLNLLQAAIHSDYPPDLTVAEAHAIKHANWPSRENPRPIDRRTLYPELKDPWGDTILIRKLPGTEWINIHSGHYIKIEAIGFDDQGYPQADHGEGVLHYQTSLIFWDKTRPLIEHWMQVSNPLTKARWALFRLDFTAGRCVRNKHKPLKNSDYQEALETARTWAIMGMIQAEDILDITTKHFGPQQAALF